MGGLTGMPSDTPLPRELGVPSSKPLAGGEGQNLPMNADGRGTGLVSHQQLARLVAQGISAWSPGMGGLQGILGEVDTSGVHAMTTTCVNTNTLCMHRPQVFYLCVCGQSLPPSLGFSGQLTQGWEQSPI